MGNSIRNPKRDRIQLKLNEPVSEVKRMSWIILLLAGCLIPNDARAQELEHGTLIGEFPAGSGVPNLLPPSVERVDGSLVAKDRPEEIRPENKLETGSLVEHFSQRPQQHQVRSAIARSGRSMPRRMGNIETKKGNVLDEDVQIGSYVPNPTKVLAELLYDPEHLDRLQEHEQHGEHALDVVEGKVVAGDPATLDVIDAGGDFAEHLQKHIQSRIKHHLPYEHMTNNGGHVIDHPGTHGEAGGQSSSEEMGRYGGGSSSSEEDNGGRGWGNYGGSRTDDDFRRPGEWRSAVVCKSIVSRTSDQWCEDNCQKGAHPACMDSSPDQHCTCSDTSGLGGRGGCCKYDGGHCVEHCP